MPDAPVNAESSTAPAIQAPENPLESFTPEQHAKWLETGEMPAKVAPEPEGSAPSQSAGEKPGSAPESETGQQESRQEKPKQNAETRKQQLSAEIQDLLEKRRALREEVDRLSKGDKPPEAPAGKKEEPQTPQRPQRPKRPRQDEFETWDALHAAEEKYEQELDKYEEDLADWKAGQRIERERAEYNRSVREDQIHTENQKRLTSWQERSNQAKERYADFDKVVGSAEALPLNPVMDELILRHKMGPDIVYHLAKNPGEAARIAALDPYDTAAELTRFADRISAKQPPKTPTPKTVSEAKEPPTLLTGTNAGAADEAKAAQEAGDFERYFNAMNARDAARMR